MVLLAKKQTQRIVFTLKNATSNMHQPDTARRENIVFTLKNATSNMTMLIKH